MTVFENIKSKNIEELVDWLYKNGAYDFAPWDRWFDRVYCKKCEAIRESPKDLCGEHTCAWCEMHNKCKYFQDMKRVPDRKQIIKMWLESEC